MQQDKNIYCYHCFAQIINPDHKLCPECGNKHSVHYSQSSELPAGTYLSGNRYIVGKSIGSGGFGITYIGFDTKLKKKILIKETFYSGIFQRNVFNKDNPEPLKVTYSKDISLDDIMHKTEKECVSLSEAEGLENIVKVYDWFSENNTAYIITEFINGVTLYDKVTSDGRYTWNELSRKITPLMNSLAALHEKNILHRDIKPQNIMIRQLKHTSESFVLIDFGLARSNSTRTLASVGLAFSPGYSPLEQRTFVKKDGTYTDVYALAATIYFALTGEEPNEDICDTIEGNFPKINVMTSKYGVPENVVNALKSALAMNTAERCQTIEELESIINNEHSDTAQKDSADKNVHVTAAKISLNKDTDSSVTSRNIKSTSETISVNHKDTDNFRFSRDIKSTSETISVNHTADNNEDYDFFKDIGNDNTEADKPKSQNEYVVLENPNRVMAFFKNSKVFISVVVGMILAASAFSIYSLNPPEKEPRAYTPIESQSTEKNSDTVSSSMSNNTSSAVTSSNNENTSSAVTSSKKTENSSSAVTSSRKTGNSSSAATSSKKTENSSSAVTSSKKTGNSSSAVTSSKKTENSSSAVTSSKKTENTSSAVTSSKKSENTSSAADVKNNTASQAASTAPVVNNKVTVPKIVGTNAQDAMNTLTSLNLYYTGNYTYDDNVPQGQVISQSPEEGSEVDKNSRVNFVISNGKEPQPQEQVTTYTYTVTDGGNGGSTTQQTTNAVPDFSKESVADYVVGTWKAICFKDDMKKETKYTGYNNKEMVLTSDGQCYISDYDNNDFRTGTYKGCPYSYYGGYNWVQISDPRGSFHESYIDEYGRLLVFHNDTHVYYTVFERAD